MEAADFKQANLILKSGNNPNTQDLRAGRALDPNGNRCMVAKFTLDEEEIKRINKDGFIYVSVRGDNWPPLLLSTHDPYVSLGYERIDPSGMPKDFPYRDRLRDLVYKIFYDKKTMSKEYFEEFIGYLNMTMPMSFPQLGKMFDDKLKSEHLMIATQLQSFEAMLRKHNMVEKIFRNEYNERREGGCDGCD